MLLLIIPHQVFNTFSALVIIALFSEKQMTKRKSQTKKTNKKKKMLSIIKIRVFCRQSTLIFLLNKNFFLDFQKRTVQQKKRVKINNWLKRTLFIIKIIQEHISPVTALWRQSCILLNLKKLNLNKTTEIINMILLMRRYSQVHI